MPKAMIFTRRASIPDAMATGSDSCTAAICSPSRERCRANRSSSINARDAEQQRVRVAILDDPPAEEPRRRQAEPVGAVGDRVPGVEHPLRGGGERVGGEREIDLSQPQRRHRDHHRDRRREQTAGEQRQRKDEAEPVAEHARRVDADAEEGDMGEGELPGQAKQHIEAECEHRIHEQQVGEIDAVGGQERQ